MTRTRKLAVGISSRVVRWASPGCKEWAEGLACEAAVIESDWTALGWALGSTRVLLDRREAPITSLADAQTVAQKFFAKKNKEDSFYPAIYAFYIIPTAAIFYMAEKYSVGFGACLALGGMLFLLYREHSYRSFAMRQPVDLKECVLYYRSELQRLTKSVYGWKTLLGFTVFFSGVLVMLYCDVVHVHGVTSISHWIRGNITFILMPLPLTIMMYMRLCKYQRQIANIDALLAEREHLGEL
jgi:hypothetical protein